jgi:hypothetical protein
LKPFACIWFDMNPRLPRGAPSVDWTKHHTEIEALEAMRSLTASGHRAFIVDVTVRPKKRRKFDSEEFDKSIKAKPPAELPRPRESEFDARGDIKADKQQKRPHPWSHRPVNREPLPQ